MTKKYRNERHGFEMDIPVDWVSVANPTPSSFFGETLLFYCGPEETFNIIVGLLAPEDELSATEKHFNRYASERGYSVISVATIRADGKDHFCASYIIPPNHVWTKKYMIVFNETEFDITASCFSEAAFTQTEKKWDEIVKTFKIYRHKQPTPIDEAERMTNAGIYFEYGNSLFNAGKYREAIEQFEKGKALGGILPSNSFGIAVTIMQMIEKELIPEAEVSSQLTRAEKNIKDCIRISPTQPDYREVERLIMEKKKDLRK